MADARPFHWEYVPEPVAKEVFRIEGGRALSGTVRISGAKNSALKLLAAATLTGERCRFTNVPEIEDVRVMAQSLTELGVTVDHPEPNVYEVAAGDVEWLFVPLEAAAKMRASFMLLGPLLSRFGRVIISNPGGDRIGRRPVNLHVEAMRSMGARRSSTATATTSRPSPGRLRGTEIRFPFVSVMGTENAMLAADACRGPHDHPAGRAGAGGRRPHRVPPEDGRGRRADLSRHDRGRGATAAPWRGAPRRARPDRGRHVHRRGRRHGWQPPPRRRAVRPPRRLRRDDAASGRAASTAARTPSRSTARRSIGTGYQAVDIETAPYPGLATDLQPPTSVVLTQATGTSHVHETIFEDRLEWLTEVGRMGADVRMLDSHHAAITGRSALHGADVEIGDLRAGASLILAALAATGTTTIHGAHHVHRGYENIEGKFLSLGARIERLAEGNDATTS